MAHLTLKDLETSDLLTGENLLAICDPLDFLRLRPEMRREVLSYLWRVSRDHGLRTFEATGPAEQSMIG